MKMTYGDSTEVVGEVGGEVVVVVVKAVINNGLRERGRKVILGRGNIRVGGGGRRGREELVVGKV